MSLVNKDKNINVRVDSLTYDYLTVKASERGVSLSDLVRQLIDEYRFTEERLLALKSVISDTSDLSPLDRVKALKSFIDQNGNK